MRKRIGSLIAATLGANILFAVVNVPGAFATSITVNTAADIAPNSSGNFPNDGLCSLRAAIRSAQNNSNSHDVDCATGLGGGVKDIIFISPSLAGSTMTLTWNPGTGVQGFDAIYDMTNPLEIIGPTTNPADFVIHGGGNVRPFIVGWVTSARGDLKLANLTVRGGNGRANNSLAPAVDGMGGAFYLNADGSGSGSHLTLDNVVVRNNSAATRGGAIYGDAPTITNNGGAYISNSSGNGGALAVDSGPFTMNGYAVLFDGNTATGFGGVIYTNPGGNPAMVHVERSLIKGNTAGTGGVLYIDSSNPGLVFRLQDSTITANSSVFFAVSTTQSYEYLRNTFVNSGQIFRAGRGFTANSIITGTNSCTNTTSATLHTGSRNLIDGSGCTILNSTNAGAVTGLAASLAQNGGPEVQQTYALSSTSNAIDNADATYCGSVDARSVARGINGAGAANSPQTGDCDIGAYEYAKYVVNFVTGVSQTDEGINAQIPVRLRMLDPGETALLSPVTVNVALASGSTARIGPSLTHDDVDVPGGSVVFPAGSTDGATALLTVNVHQDAIAERFGETARVELVAGGTAGVAIAEPRQHELGIRDDDQAGVVVTESGGSTVVSEGSPTVADSITVRLQSQPDYEQTDPSDPHSYGPPADVTIRVTPDRDCTVRVGSTIGTESSPLTTLILNANWQTGVVIDVLPVDDAYDEDLRDESVTHECELRYTFSSLDPVYASTQDASTVTVHDNDVAGVTVTRASGATPLVEGSPDGVVYSVRLASAPDPGKPLPSTPRGPTGVVVTPNVQCDAGSGPGVAGTLNFTSANWNTTQQFTVYAAQDLNVELLHNCMTVTSVASPDPVYANLSAAPTFTGTPPSFAFDMQDYVPPAITDDPPFADVTIVGGATVTEGSTTPTQVRVVLRRAPVTANVTIDVVSVVDPVIGGPQLLVATGGAGATTATQLVFTPANWSVPQTLSVTAANDDYDETETHSGQLRFSMSSAAVGFNDVSLRRIVINGTEFSGQAEASIAIADNDTSEVLLAPAGGSLAPIEGGTPATLQVSLATHPYAAVTVHLSAGTECLVDGSSTQSIDVAAGDWASLRPVTVSAVDDALVEASPLPCAIDVEVTSTDLLYDVLSYDVSAAVIDNDVAGAALSTAAPFTAEEGGSPATISAVLLGQPDAPVEVRITDSSGQVDPVTLTFTASNWSTPQQATLQAIDDQIDEISPAATPLAIALVSSATGFTSPRITVDRSAAALVNVAVIDNDVAALSPSALTLTALAEAGPSEAFTVGLATEPTGAVVVAITASGLCSVAPGSVTLDGTNWSTGILVAVTPLDDAIVHAQSCALQLAATSADPFYDGLTAALSGVVADNDVAAINVSAGDLEVAEHNTMTQSYTIVLSSEPTDTVVITIVPDGQLTSTTPPLNFDASNWNTPQTVTIAAFDDSTLEPTPHLATVNHTVTANAIEYASAAAAPVTVAVRDDDTTLALTVTPSPANDGVATVVSAGVVGGDGPAGGTVTFRIDGVDAGAPVAVVAGAASADLGPLARGTYTLSAHYSGDTTHEPSAATATHHVTAVPNAADDSTTVAEDSGETTIAVRANDTDADGDDLTIASHSQPAHGTVSCDTLSCRYTPDRDFNGTDSFTYEITDGALRDAATVSITVTPVNDAPVPPPRATFAVKGDEPFTFDLLEGAVDVDGDLLVLLSYEQPAHGTVTCASHGVCTYTPAAGYSGPDSFAYIVGDGTAAPKLSLRGVHLQAGGVARFQVAARATDPAGAGSGDATGAGNSASGAATGAAANAGQPTDGSAGAGGAGSGAPGRGNQTLAYTGAEPSSRLRLAALLLTLGGALLAIDRRRRPIRRHTR